VPELRFLADESCDYSVVRALRADGHDVLAVSDETTRSVDHELIDQARREERILLTEDKDFGWLVFVSAAESAGVVLIRFPGNARTELAQTISKLVNEEAESSFAVVQPGYIRIHRQPDD
jgi:predicted nuclease of predicted toxin-antitoxin system